MSDAETGSLEDLRYPIGKFTWTTEPVDPATREDLVDRIAALPEELRTAVQGLDDRQLDTPYRDGGWTPRQVVHHVADSHINAYVRFKLAATEDDPPVKPYDQAAWAELTDSDLPVDVSLAILDGLHRRWVRHLRSLDGAGFRRTVHHPEWGTVAVDVFLQLYAWHGRHHTAHITGLRERRGW